MKGFMRLRERTFSKPLEPRPSRMRSSRCSAIRRCGRHWERAHETIFRVTGLGKSIFWLWKARCWRLPVFEIASQSLIEAAEQQARFEHRLAASRDEEWAG